MEVEEVLPLLGSHDDLQEWTQEIAQPGTGRKAKTGNAKSLSGLLKMTTLIRLWEPDRAPFKSWDAAWCP